MAGTNIAVTEGQIKIDVVNVGTIYPYEKDASVSTDIWGRRKEAESILGRTKEFVRSVGIDNWDFRLEENKYSIVIETGK